MAINIFKVYLIKTPAIETSDIDNGQFLKKTYSKLGFPDKIQDHMRHNYAKMFLIKVQI